MRADDISTGLDSATTKDIVEACRVGCEELGFTCVIALLQPPPEVMALFERVVLMRDGHIVYHGAMQAPRSCSLPVMSRSRRSRCVLSCTVAVVLGAGPLDTLPAYFAGMGLPCPEDTDLAGAALQPGPASASCPDALRGYVCVSTGTDFYVEYLSDPDIIWSRRLKALREENRDASYMPAAKPPLTTEDMLLFFRAYMRRDDWSALATTAALPSPVRSYSPVASHSQAPLMRVSL